MFKNLRIGVRLGLGIGAIAFLVLMVGVFSIWRLWDLDQMLNRIVDDRWPKTVVANKVIDNVNLAARAVRNAIILDDSTEVGEELKRVLVSREAISKGLDELHKTLQSGEGKDLLRKITDARGKYASELDDTMRLIESGNREQAKVSLITKLRPLQADYFKSVDDLVAYQGKMMDLAGEEATADYKSSRNLIIIALLVSLFLSATVNILVTRSIARPITRVVEGLTEGADQVAAASGQVAASSQSLAEGASEQAASLEETSSSLEEMASMTRQNADHANQANSLMKEITRVVEESTTAMGKLTTSMKDISSASEETSKIIKTIDEIAFQTNLLALNAAVEAARAGEAGAGFAVVADEVRNLAMRAAEAAKNTTNLIEGTIKKIKEGTEQVDKAGEAFQLVATGTGKMGELVGEVAAASGEQAQGIDQVNLAVAEMDKVIQQNAANAEESAAASEELNAQAEQMKSYVNELVAVVAGSGKKVASGSARLTAGSKVTANEPQIIFESPRMAKNAPMRRKGNGKASALSKANKVLADHASPPQEALSNF
jgi:methyl-accepting chemotaxis protein